MERHRFDPVSFVFGVLFAAFGLLGLTDLFVLRAIDLRWIGPLLLVLVGLVLLLSSARGGSAGSEDRAGQQDHGQRDQRQTHDVDDDAGTDHPADRDAAGAEHDRVGGRGDG